MTLEAAIGLTIFIFAMTCMMLPMKIMNTRRQAQAALEAVGEDLSRYAYAQQMLEQSDSGKLPDENGGDGTMEMFLRYLAEGAAESYLLAQVRGKVNTVAFQNSRADSSEILADGEMIDLVVDYEIRMPFPVLALNAVPQSVRCCRRAWIGKAGKDYGEGGAQAEAGDEIVYVGKNSTRYHRSRTCHYLSNNLTAVTLGEGKTCTSAEGRTCHACSVCGGSAKPGDTVYVMPSGRNYHADRECRAIIAYVRAVKLSEVEQLGACSYCSSGNK